MKAYKAKLIVFPRKAGKAKKGDSEVMYTKIKKKEDVDFYEMSKMMVAMEIFQIWEEIKLK